jgi:hypothetical protein
MIAVSSLSLPISHDSCSLLQAFSEYVNKTLKQAISKSKELFPNKHQLILIKIVKIFKSFIKLLHLTETNNSTDKNKKSCRLIQQLCKK